MKRATFVVSTIFRSFGVNSLLRAGVSMFLQVALVGGLLTSWGQLAQAQPAQDFITIQASPETQAVTGFAQFSVGQLANGNTRFIGYNSQGSQVVSLDISVRRAGGSSVFNVASGSVNADFITINPDRTYSINEAGVQTLAQSSLAVQILFANGDLIRQDLEPVFTSRWLCALAVALLIGVVACCVIPNPGTFICCDAIPIAIDAVILACT